MSLVLGPGVARPETPRVVAYVPNWIDLKSFSETIAYSNLTHINIAFENPPTDAGDLSFHANNLPLIAQARTNHVKILISIGGGAASGDAILLARYRHLLNETNRAGFVAQLANYVVTNNFDGLDVDLEGPSITADYSAFIAALAAALKPEGKLLTAALSQGYGGRNVPDATLTRFDFVNIMAYDASGPWSPNSPGPHSSYEFATNQITYWLGRGLPRAKAVLGVPFYGYGFGPAARKRDYPYKAIVAEFPGAERCDQIGDTIWYNGIPTIAAKTRYVREQGLGGIMIWSLDGDSAGAKSLLSTIQGTLSAGASK